MKVLPDIVVCTQCDAIYRRPTLARDHLAQCNVCNAVVLRPASRSIDEWLALTLASAIMFALANTFPIISAGVKNYQNDVTLWTSVTSLAQSTWAVVAALAATVTIVAPLLQIVLLGWLLAFARRGKRAPAFRRIMKVLWTIQPWSMIEVAFLGVVVAALKMSGMANVTIGAGAWAMLAAIGLTAFTTKRDARWLWHIEAIDPDHGARKTA